MDLKVKNAIISVSDKTGLVELSKKLHELGINIYSTGGTAKAIENVGIPVTRISEYTGFPEILDGRVKSLHPKIHGGILAKKDNDNHMVQLKENKIIAFDLVVINLYPFESVVKKDNVRIEEAIENIDIGGPTMLRSAAKNYEWVAVVPDPQYYDEVLKKLEKNGSISFETRKKLAMAVFEKTAYYDSLISSYFHNIVVEHPKSKFPDTINFYFKKRQDLRYGENPHQAAAFYFSPDIKVKGVSTAKKLHGKELSFNNILDIEAAFEIVKEFDDPACSIMKHTNPCGASVALNLKDAFKQALASDPMAAFGSIIGLNKFVDSKTAKEIHEAGFIECIIAPGYDDEALKILAAKKNIRLLETGKIKKNEVYDYDMKRVIGGVLIQSRDLKDITRDDIKVVTEKVPTDEQLESLLFGWKIVKHVKSNAIVITQGKKTVGVGAGQMSRVDSVFVAIEKAKGRLEGSALASDAFFPKSDAVELAGKAGIKAIIQPGGSIRDNEVIDACNRMGVSMVFTGIRHFRH